MTQQNKLYKLSSKYEMIIHEEELKFKFNKKCILDNIKDLCKSLELLQDEHEKMNKFVNAISSIARKDSIAQNCSMNVLIYSGNVCLFNFKNQFQCIIQILQIYRC